MAATDSAQIYQDVRIGLETTAGTAVQATKRLQSLKIVSKPKPEVSNFKAAGSKYANITALDAEFDEPEITGKPSYTELPYLFALAAQRVVSGTLAAGGAAAAYDWTFSPATYSEDTLASLSLEYGSEKRVENQAGAALTALGFTFPRRGETAISGALIAQRIEDDHQRYIRITGSPTGGTFTLTVGGQTTSAIAYNATASAVQTALEALSNVDPGDVTVVGTAANSTNGLRVFFTGQFANTAIPAITASGASLTGGTSPAVVITRLAASVTEIPMTPLTAPQIDVYVTTTQAGLAGASRLNRVFNYGWQIGDRQSPVWEFNTSIPSYADIVEGEPSSQGTITVGANDTTMGLFLTALRTSAPLFTRVLATGPLIETAGSNKYYHTLRLDSCVRVTGMSEKKAAGQLVSRDFSLLLAHDATWGRAWEAFIRTTTAAL